MESRSLHPSQRGPIAIYEVHLTSWMRMPEDGNRAPTYREVAPKLADYVQRHGFTHVQLSLSDRYLPDPSFRSFPPSHSAGQRQRQGGPQDFMFLVDLLHQENIGTILSWSPSPGQDNDETGASDEPEFLMRDERPLEPGGVQTFDFARPEVRQFLLNNAGSWLEHYHIDGLFVDLDLLKRPNEENLAGNPAVVEFLQQLNEMVTRDFPDVQTYARESTGWSQVARPVHAGGLGFSFKWDVRWRRDTLSYLSQDPLFRKYHHEQFQHREPDALRSEKVVLPLAEAAGGGQGPSILTLMPGDDWQRFANLRLLLAYQWALPGKKLLFMGTEFGQWKGWDPNNSLDWHLVQPRNIHNGVQKLIGHLNWLYRHEPALHHDEDSPDVFEWVDKDDAAQSTLAFLRKSDPAGQGDLVLALFNFTPVPRHNRRFGVPRGGFWREILNTDSGDYGGSGQGNLGGLESAPFAWNSRPHSLHVTLPPLAAVYFRQTAADPGPTRMADR
jgi:1,4-alpha-glucan branching enzyme